MQTSIEFVPGLLGETIMQALSDEQVMDIIVNSDGTLLLDHKVRGKQVVGVCDLDKVAHAMKALCQYRHCFLNAKTPDQTLQLPTGAPYYGARMKCLIPPITPAPSMVIRRHAKTFYPLEDFIQKRIVTSEQGAFLRQCIVEYRNICVVGIPQSGKTALTAALINEIHQLTPNDRILVLENTPEIYVDSCDVQALQTGARSMQQLVQSATQMRPDRLIIGEVTDHCAHDMLKAWNIGCSGGICTFHAKDCAAAPLRLAELCSEKGIAPPHALIRTVVDVIVHMVRDVNHPAGRRVKAMACLEESSKGQGGYTLTFINT